jgi:MEMO1 family protein
MPEYQMVRPSAIAGAWYPGTATGLRAKVDALLAAVTPVELPGRLLAFVVPHAGYAYSGEVAAQAYAQLRGDETATTGFDRVVLLGPLHRLIRGSAIGAYMAPSERAFRTPLGDVAVDRDFLTALGQRVMLTPVRQDEEHSLEIQLPFLQRTLGEFSLVPIMMGFSLSERGAGAYVEALAEALADLSDDRTLLVASTDLSHLDNYAEVVATDRELVERVGAFDVDGLVEALRIGRVNACGDAGLATVLRAAEKRGATGAEVLKYAASGDVTGDKRPGVYTVGYLAAAVYR